MAMVHAQKNLKHNRLHYRLTATSKVTGGKNYVSGKTFDPNAKPKISLGFSTEKYSVLENAEWVTIYVERTGPLEQNLEVKFECLDGTARDTIEYNKPSENTLKFTNQAKVLEIKIGVIDNNEPNEDKIFKVKLSGLKLLDESQKDNFELEIKTPETEITIIDDDFPGVF